MSYTSYEIHQGFYDEAQNIPKMYGLTRHDLMCDEVQESFQMSEFEGTVRIVQTIRKPLEDEVARLTEELKKHKPSKVPDSYLQ